MRLELTRVGLLVELANHYTTRGAQILLRFTDDNNRLAAKDLLDQKLRQSKRNLFPSRI